MNLPEDPKQGHPRLLFWFLMIGSVALMVVCFFGMRDTWLGSAVNAGEYGALLQGIAGSLALILLGWTVYLQQRELALQRLELRHTREEMERSTAEQRRLADQATNQLEAMRRQGDLLSEQLAQQVRPMLRLDLVAENHIGVYLCNDGLERAIVTRVSCAVNGKEQDLGSFVRGLHEVLRAGTEPQTPPIERTQQVQAHAPLLSANRDSTTPEVWRAFLERIASCILRVEYMDIFGHEQSPLVQDLSGLTRRWDAFVSRPR